MYQLVFTHPQLEAHTYIGFNKPVSVVHHDSIMIPVLTKAKCYLNSFIDLSCYHIC